MDLSRSDTARHGRELQGNGFAQLSLETEENSNVWKCLEQKRKCDV